MQKKSRDSSQIKWFFSLLIGKMSQSPQQTTQADKQQPTTPRGENVVTKEWSAFSRLVDSAYDTLTVPFSVIIPLVYFISNDDRRAWLIVPMTCLFIPLLCTKFLLFCHRHGFLTTIYNAVHSFVGGAFVRVWLNVKVLRQSKPGQVSLWFALLNLVYFTAHWCYTNVDLLKLGRSLYLMLYTLATSLRDPVAIMLSFQETLKTLSLYKAMEYVRLNYVNQTVSAIDNGRISVLFDVFLVSVVLVVVAILFYIFPNYVWPVIGNPSGWLSLQRYATNIDDEETTTTTQSKLATSAQKNKKKFQHSVDRDGVVEVLRD